MKITEIIERLEAIKNEHGDLLIRKSSCHSIPIWQTPKLQVFTHTEKMDERFIYEDKNVVLKVGEKFIWL